MADYRTHLLGGMVAGAAAAATAAWFAWTEPWRLPLVGVVGVVGGLAPDIDSDNSRPVKILFRTAAVVIPTALVWRVAPLHAVPERALVAWVLLASFVRWPLCWLFKRATVHRGIFHSVPAIVIFGCACFLFAGRRAEDAEHQLAFGLAGALGYLTHLLLDELWSVDFNGMQLKTKRSAGTALSLTGLGLPTTVLAWGLCVVMGGLVWQSLEGLIPEDLWLAWGGERFLAQLGETWGTLQRLFSEWLEGVA
jgi:membrane-bound metal-dependent hydrolase YbcI (DUF457 family)